MRRCARESRGSRRTESRGDAQGRRRRQSVRPRDSGEPPADTQLCQHPADKTVTTWWQEAMVAGVGAAADAGDRVRGENAEETGAGSGGRAR